LDGIKQISAIKIDVFERISSLLDFNNFENISDKFSSTVEIASRTSLLVDILHKTDNIDKIKALSFNLSNVISRLIPSLNKQQKKREIQYSK
jgi:hypothetical protein